MKNFGEIFRELRKTKKLTLEEVADNEFSISLLSKFENGKTEISFQKLDKALSNIRVSMNEFYYLVSGFESDKTNSFFSEMYRLDNNKDILGLKKLYDSEVGKSSTSKLGRFNILNSIIIASYIKKYDEDFEISKSHKNILHDYLFGIEIWGEYEMTLLLNSIDFITAKLYMEYAKEMVKKVDYFKFFPHIMNLIQTVLIHGIFLSLEQDYKFGASYFVNKANEYILDTRDLYMQIVFNFAKGYFYIYRGDKEEGKQIIEESIEILQKLGNTSAKYYSNAYKEILEKY